MRGLFCSTVARTNEEYRKVVKTRMNAMVILFIIGVITLAVSLLAEFRWTVTINDRMLGVYTGVGTGLSFASVSIWIMNRKLLNNEEKLKESRLSYSDERIKEISNKAFRVAAVVLLIVLYGIGLIGGLFYPFLMKVLGACVGIFVCAYLISYFIYSKRM